MLKLGIEGESSPYGRYDGTAGAGGAGVGRGCGNIRDGAGDLMGSLGAGLGCGVGYESGLAAVEGSNRDGGLWERWSEIIGGQE